MASTSGAHAGRAVPAVRHSTWERTGPDRLIQFGFADALRSLRRCSARSSSTARGPSNEWETPSIANHLVVIEFAVPFALPNRRFVASSRAPPALVPEQAPPSLVTGAVVVVTCVMGVSIQSSPVGPTTLTVTVAGVPASAEGAARTRWPGARTARLPARPQRDRRRAERRQKRRETMSMEPTPFHEGLWACGRRQVSWLPGLPSAPSRPPAADQWLRA